MSRKVYLLVVPVLFLVLLNGCKSHAPIQSLVDKLDHPTTSATLWTFNSAEYQALTTSVYRTAASNLALAVEDSYWTAYPK